MKLVVMIPAFNEEKSISKVIKEIPNKISGIDEIEILVINDGSTDRTAEEAKKAGAHRILSHKKKHGACKVLQRWLRRSVDHGS